MTDTAKQKRPTGATYVRLHERLVELERYLGREWVELGGADSDFEFSREGLRVITRLARLMRLKNPIIGRGVGIKSDYTFGRGVNITAADEDINAVLRAWRDDNQNTAELTGHIAQLEKDKDLQTEGNVFLSLFVHPVTGKVRISSIPFDEITDIITDPDNRKRPWFYKREWYAQVVDYATGELKEEKRSRYYRDWRYADTQVQQIGSVAIDGEAVIYHIKVGGLSHWRYGLCDFYSGIDWARAYKSFLEDFATIVKALSRFAWRAKTKGGARGLAAGKAKLSTTAYTDGSSLEGNPAPVTGSVFIQDADIPGSALDPIKTAGATTSAEEGRRLMLMVAAALGLPETFFGDVSVGTLATATSLDRPTELMLGNRQKLWAAVYYDLVYFVIYCAVTAPEGPLRLLARVQTDEYGDPQIIYADSIDPNVDVDFPSLVERSTLEYVQAIKTAATLDGATPTVLPDLRLLAKMMLLALGEDDVDTIVADLFPEGADPQLPAPTSNPEQATVAAAVEALREAIKGLQNAAETDHA